MKKIIIPILILTLISCKKEVDQPTIKKTYQLTAIMNVKVSQETVYFDVFVSNDRNAPINLWLFVKRIYKADMKTNLFTFGFDAPSVCWLVVQSNMPVYGCSRETITGYVQKEIDFNNVTIKN